MPVVRRRQAVSRLVPIAAGLRGVRLPVRTREPGFYLGSIYINYGLTALLVTAGYFALYFTEVVSPDMALWLCMAFCLLFPLCFFRFARSLWLGLDYYFDPKTAHR